MDIQHGSPVSQPYLTVPEVADQLRISRWKVYDLIRVVVRSQDMLYRSFSRHA
jgi:hypothetical protein